MVDAESLTLAFVTAHPAEAARILERLGTADAAALFERIPTRAGAPVLSTMLPSVAARIVSALKADTGRSLLAALGTQAAVSILRQTNETRRRELVSGLPTATAMASRLLLYYADDSVGAWIDPDIVVFPLETSVADALTRIGNGNEPVVELVFSVDDEQRLKGVARLHQLLRVPSDRKLASIVEKPGTVLNASSTISSISKRRGWQQSAVLPVTDRDGKLIGVLRRSTLDRALARGHQPAPANDSEVLVSMCASGYWNAFSALAHAIVSLLPGGKPIEQEKP